MMIVVLFAVFVIVCGGIAAEAHEQGSHKTAIFAAFWCGYNFVIFLEKVVQ